MAKKKSNTGNITSSTEINTFVKGMNKDVNASFVPKESWFHARNAYNNSPDGDAGTIGNEPANLRCSDIPYPVIGAIYKQGDQWYIFSTDDVSSEIGILDDSKCEYTTLINDPCLNFKRTHLITGASKENYDCTWQVYWDDNLNPSRTLNENNIPYIQIQITGPDINGEDCITFEDTINLDCEKIRLAPLVTTPCLTLTKNIDGGQLENGSYQAFVAYVVNEQKVTDYIGISNVQSVFIHEDVGSSINLTLTDLDTSFEFFELVILSNTKEQSVAKKIGIYSTQQSSIALDFIDPATTSVPLEVLFARNPAYERSESMYVVNDYLIRQGPTEQFDFNYQPLANQIIAKWQVAEYPADYYYKGGYKTSFMRDEQYAFFIRWIYNTGERSASYHIPGRAAKTGSFFGNGQQISGNEKDVVININSLNTDEENWQIFNTGEKTANLNIALDDGGVIISEGDMAYWESTERYPATQPEIWDASSNPIWGGQPSIHDLCGKYIRHHKMPTEEVDFTLDLYNPSNNKIRLLGVKFENIKRPLFNDGTVIPNIVGYEILRGSREGAKSILAKGIFRNMRKYKIPEEDPTSNIQGLYPNYPYNDLRDDTFFHTGVNSPFIGPFPTSPLTGKRTEDLQVFPDSIKKAPPLKGYAQDIFTFHTPELPFRLPYLNAYETRFYGKYKGISEGYFRKSEEHPGEKLMRNVPIIFAAILGIGYAMEQLKGKQNFTKLPIQLAHYSPYYKEAEYSLTLSPIPYSGPSGTLSVSNTGSTFAFTQPYTNSNSASTIAATAGGVFGAQYGVSTVLETFFTDIASDLADIFTGGLFSEGKQQVDAATQDTGYIALPGTFGGGIQHLSEGSNFKSLPSVLRGIFSIPAFLVYTAEGANVLIELFYNLMSYQDYALKHNSHGFYSYRENLQGSLFRSRNENANYIGSSFVSFGDTTTGLYKINNLFRPDTVVIQTTQEFKSDPSPNEDRSRYSLGQLESEDPLNSLFQNIHLGTMDKIRQPICSLYGSLKFKFDNQYGQLGGVKQTPMRACVQKVDIADPAPYTSDAFFAGDVYINRYTEKTIMPIFTDFLYKQPDGYVYDYSKYVNIPYPRYWMNTERYDFTKLYSIVEDFANSFSGQQNDYFQYLPSDLYALDVPLAMVVNPFEATADNNGVVQPFMNGLRQGFIGVTNAFMYTHINGVQDFYVESELNIANRDWQNTKDKRHYDYYRYNDLNELFDAEFIRKGNFYLYDYSLSISRQITNLTNFSFIQPLDYDPTVAETCYTFYPKRLIYSLRAQEESKKDFWRVFLPNNYKDFKNKVSVIKPINQTGALMLFPYASPKMFQGVDQLQTDLGTKVILGDGGLFAREPQNITNSDLANEYASCESARSVINTPMGVFFISQAQGKIFHYTGKLAAISDLGMKWWFNKYLPSILLKQFPELEGTELEDNPVVGIGCQAIYDINDDIVYFMKKDYAVKEARLAGMSFNPETLTFTFSTDITSFPVALGDPDYFDDVSWTVSYDPKIKGWISFHDWHPELSLPSINHFLTTKTFITDQPLCPFPYVLNNDTGFCELLQTSSLPGFVTPLYTPVSIISNNCPPDYVFDPITQQCILTEQEAPNQFGQTFNVSAAANVGGSGALGPYFYVDASTRPGPFDNVLPGGPQTYTYGNNVSWPSTHSNNQMFDALDNFLSPTIGTGNSSADSVIGNRYNVAAVWTNLFNSNGDRLPIGEWIGFVACIDVPTDGWYSVLMAGDNQVRFFVDGNLFADIGTGTFIGVGPTGPNYNFSSLNTFPFNRMHIFPIYLTAGTHSIQLEGYNNDASGGFVAEVINIDMINNINDFAALTTQALYEDPSNLLWSSIDQVGGVFDTGEQSGFSCNEGWDLVWTEGCGELVCQRTIAVDAESGCFCEPGYTIVYPDVTTSPIEWTQETGDCETIILDNLGQPGNGQPIVQQFNLDCPTDIVFVVQADDSTDTFDGNNPTQRQMQIEYIREFITSPDIANAINNNTFQVGLTTFARDSFNAGCNGNNLRFAASINNRFDDSGDWMISSNSSRNANDIANTFSNWLNDNNNWPGNSIFPATTWGVDYGQRYAIENVINPRATNSQLGDREPGNPNYRSFVIHVTGVVNLWNASGTPQCFTFNNICNHNLSINQTPGGSGPSHMYSMLVYVANNDTRSFPYGPGQPGGWLSALIGNTDHSFQINDVSNSYDYSEPVEGMINLMKEICNNPTSTTDACDCYDYSIQIGNTDLNEYDIIYQECVSGTWLSQQVSNSSNTVVTCVREGSVSVVQNIDPALLVITEGDLCETQYDCNSGPSEGPQFTTIEPVCRKIECGCPDSPYPNGDVEQIGDCDDPDLVYDIGSSNFISPSIICNYSSLLQLPPSFVRGSIWRHNYRCDLYANYYDVDYPWEVELVENTGQMVNIVKSMEYQLETYVYKGDLHDGCGDDRWHDLDFNFDKAIIYNSEQVSGLLTLIPHPKEDPLNMINYPIIGGTDIQILYSKEEQKFRFNQFWDITADRGEFTNAEQNIFITRLNGYIKDLNFQNLLYSKPSNQRKKFRHYYNKVILRRTLSGNRKMLLKLNNTKLNLSMR